MSNQAETQVQYRERVAPKWTSFLPLLLIMPTFWLTFAPINALIGAVIGLLVTATVATLMLVNSPVIEVSDGYLQVGRARMPIKLISGVIEVPKGEVFAERGPKLDARAYVRLQPSVSGLLRVQIKDKNDPTPYWLFSSRNPKLLTLKLKEAGN